MSLAAGAFALLGTGSVALVSVQWPGVASFRHPVTLTISIFLGAGAACAAIRPKRNTSVVMGRMITPVTRRSTQNPRKPQREIVSLCVQRVLRCTSLALVVLVASVSAHDLEKTQVSITFA